MKKNEWNSEVHTPIVYKGHMFAVGKKKPRPVHLPELRRQRGLDQRREGRVRLGSFLLADGMFFVLEGDTGMLRLIEASTTEYKELARPRCSTDRTSGGRWRCRTASWCCAT